MAAAHTQVRQYACTLCNKGFSSKGNLKVHIKRIHNKSSAENAQNCCEHCGVRMTSTRMLHNHLWAEHGVKPPAKYSE